MMASVNRIDSIFLCDSVCVSSNVVDNVPCAPLARGYVHMPFYEGTCPKKVKKPNFLNFCHRKKLNSKIWGRRKF